MPVTLVGEKPRITVHGNIFLLHAGRRDELFMTLAEACNWLDRYIRELRLNYLEDLLNG